MPTKKKPPRAGRGSGGPRPAAARARKLFAVPAPVAPDQAELTIVGVGASAGGLEAFSALLKALPKEPGVAIVFIQHLAPLHESALVPLLSGQSDLPVVQATEGMQVEANHVYVIRPN